ncbi:hypothetical protein TNCV_4678381 [Trichonephila clavipes]|nr:hypothetical protein TNCV_4678381 [Trichonephila clavipes]
MKIICISVVVAYPLGVGNLIPDSKDLVSHKKLKNSLQFRHQMPPRDTQTTKKMRRAGRKVPGSNLPSGTWIRRKNPFTILELHRSQSPLLNLAKADWRVLGPQHDAR